MTGSESTCKEGGDASGSGMATMSSRRLKGQQPDEHEDLETIVRRNRQANAAKRKTALEAKESLDQEEEDSGPDHLEAHHASPDGSGSEEASDGEGDPEREESGYEEDPEEEVSGSEGDPDEEVEDEFGPEESEREELEAAVSDAQDSGREASDDDDVEVEPPAED
ncbi:hypothetical protein V7S43_015475 [Phytophthora oleae]|uniref:BZIP domain-containing protein n=1 Tax=Phytophthora oleae TaxID=2107226 RepID=A0ABD3F1Y4_9STRA